MIVDGLGTIDDRAALKCDSTAVFGDALVGKNTAYGHRQMYPDDVALHPLSLDSGKAPSCLQSDGVLINFHLHPGREPVFVTVEM